ncbi:hypothetical protein BCR44DRAFT_1423719 [Catenaria anguillulae PL171]|uniref:Uncharacterized protein n=1 Tax=Catenaria anguillulae PL171 TaxID=765915 RepID=A0A1Y2I1J3_9FUNG|nr:hypothetical protein BCR44DRAFT_1423719 [Catenaria anguillulae PL171]
MHGAIVPALASCTAACKWTLPRVYTLEVPPGVLEQVLARIRLPAWYGLVVHPKVPMPAGEKTATTKAHGGGGKNNNNTNNSTADKAATADAGALAVTIDTHLPLSFKFARLRALHVARCKDLALNRTHMAQLTELSVHPRQLMQLGAAPHAKFGANLTTLLIEPDMLMGVLHLNTQLAFPNLKSLHLGASSPYLMPTHWTSGTGAAGASARRLDDHAAALATASPASAAPMRIEPAGRALEWLTSLPALCALYIRHPMRLVFPYAPSHVPLKLVFANKHSGNVWRELARGLDFAPCLVGRPHAGAVADRPPPVVHVRVGYPLGDNDLEVEGVVADMEPLLVALGRDEQRACDVAWRACDVARRRPGSGAGSPATTAVVEDVVGGPVICVVANEASDAKSAAAAATGGTKGRVDSAVGSSASSSRETSPVRTTAQGVPGGGRRRRIGSESARSGMPSAAKVGFARNRRATVGPGSV